MIKAPSGGSISRVNGEEYKGGQFMPEHGDYCGQGGSRIGRSDLDAISGGLPQGWSIVWNDSAAVFQLVKRITTRDGREVDQVVCSARNWRKLASAAKK